MSEIPVHFRPRRLADWINPTGAKKVHSLVDKVYKRKNLEMAWENVKANRGSGGVDGQTLETFEAQLEQPLERLHRELGVRLNPQKTRIVHIQQGFDFLGYRMVRTSGKSKIPRGMIQRWNPKG